MGPGRSIRIKDYNTGTDQTLKFGFRWTTNGTNNGEAFYVRVFCFNASLETKDEMKRNTRSSKDGSIKRVERTASNIEDDETISINLIEVKREIIFVAFVIMSDSCKPIDNILKANCHLFNSDTNIDLASYYLPHEDFKKTYSSSYLMMPCCIHRESSGWNLCSLKQITSKNDTGGNKLTSQIIAGNIEQNLGGCLSKSPSPNPTVVLEPDNVLNCRIPQQSHP